MQSEPVLKPKAWRILPQDQALLAEAVRTFPVSPVLCRILVTRGITTSSQARRFLSPDLDDLYDPFLLKDMDRAVARTREALSRGERIMVHGDYDVDGVTSTALIVRVLRILGADLTWYLPHRQREGYDIGLPAIEQAKQDGVGLILTVDCGTSAADPVRHAQDLGIDVVVTDHHELGAEVAPALAVVNPRQPDCQYPFKDLAGVGVAFKFAQALVGECGYDTAAFRRRFCDLAAVGTVADVVPLLDENRTLVKFGMEEMLRTGKKGLQALLRTSGLAGRPITSHALAFGIAPRLNAAGRLDDASIALDLLLTGDDEEAARLAGVLEAQNRERQAEQERITREALDQVASRGIDETAKVLVLCSQGWHPGIVGIVANKITDRYNRPAVLVALDETGEAGVGSARSIAAFDLFEALMQCRHLLERCGGHARAAGLSIASENVQEFEEAINRIADEVLTESDLQPRLEVDAELSVDQITYDLARELQLLEPYGHCNRIPVFMSRNVLVLQTNRMGSNGDHVKLRLATNSGRPVECVAFGWGSFYEAFRIGSLVDLCYNIRINQYAGTETVQAVLCDARPSDAVVAEPYPTAGVG